MWRRRRGPRPAVWMAPPQVDRSAAHSTHSLSIGCRSSPDILSPVPSASRTPPLTALVEATELVSPAEGRSSPSLFDGRSRKKRSSSSSSRQLLRRDTVSSPSERTSRLQQDKQMLMEEVKAQKVIDHTPISKSY